MVNNITQTLENFKGLSKLNHIFS